MAVLAIEILLGVVRHTGSSDVEASGLGLLAILAVMCVQFFLAAWQGAQARKWDSDLLRADAAHTLGDTATTAAAIGGWQAAAHGFPWVDKVLATGVALLVLYLSYRLFCRAIPILVDSAAVMPEEVRVAAGTVEGVLGVGRVRSRWDGDKRHADVTVYVHPSMSTLDAHDLADRVEAKLALSLATDDVVVHVEPFRKS